VREKQQQQHQPQTDTFRVSIIDEAIETVLAPLGIAVKKYPLDEDRVRWELQPWIIEAALDRLAPKQLTLDEQQEMWNSARALEKVRWPDWRSFRG
jgi:hypothetical protein